MALTVLCVSFTLFLILGMPVSVAIALSCLATFWTISLVVFTTIVRRYTPFTADSEAVKLSILICLRVKIIVI